MVVPEELNYTREHEWVARTGDTVRVGITDYAQQQLGDVVFVQPPAVGDTVQVGDPVGEVESTKSVSDIYAPVNGEVVAANSALEDHPELVNSDPYGEGWIFEVRVADPAALDPLLAAEDYRELTEQE